MWWCCGPSFIGGMESNRDRLIPVLIGELGPEDSFSTELGLEMALEESSTAAGKDTNTPSGDLDVDRTRVGSSPPRGL